MRAFRIFGLVVGLAIVVLLVARLGEHAALTLAARALGWQFPLICLPFALVTVIDTLGWRFAFGADRVSFHRLIAARVAGEALNVVTAVAPVGGDVVKVWLLRPRVPYRESVASVLVAKTTMTIAQTLFLLIGMGLAWGLAVDPRLVRAMLWLLLVEAVCTGGFLFVQLAGVMTRGATWLSQLHSLPAVASARSLDRTLQHFYRRRWGRLSLSIAFHLLGWILGVFETWLILRVLGVPVSPAVATLVETIGSAVRFATFFMPGSLGALEGANAAAFTALHLGAGVGLAFSLVRRGRQVVWIGIGLLVLAAARIGAARDSAARATQTVRPWRRVPPV